ncbi:methyltransferase domain-containing protein [Halorientalis marina]|uniref:methyltransferase domain-containing protein n=1 Tax=Halorientalis marina TaxID=2931976 RepID=UPI0035680EEF
MEHLPFKDDAFDFVNASQVVEHTDNPDDAIAELERVATSGQVDTPAFVNENIMFGRNFHNWTMLVPSLKGRPRFVEATHPDRERSSPSFPRPGRYRRFFMLSTPSFESSYVGTTGATAGRFIDESDRRTRTRH